MNPRMSPGNEYSFFMGIAVILEGKWTRLKKQVSNNIRSAGKFEYLFVPSPKSIRAPFCTINPPTNAKDPDEVTIAYVDEVFRSLLCVKQYHTRRIVCGTIAPSSANRSSDNRIRCCDAKSRIDDKHLLI